MQKKPFWSGPRKPSTGPRPQGARRFDRRGNNKKDKDSRAINEEIRAPQVRLVGDNVTEGIYPVRQAQRIADEQGLDLIEIAPQAQPPVCRIMDYQKFLFQQRKRAKEQKAKSTKVVVKEIRFGPQTDDHDYDFKLKHAIEFLKEGCKVKSYVFFKGRSILFKDQGEVLLLRFARDLEEYGKLEQMPVLEGKRMTVMFSPKKPKEQPKKPKEAPQARPAKQVQTPAPEAEAAPDKA